MTYAPDHQPQPLLEYDRNQPTVKQTRLALLAALEDIGDLGLGFSSANSPVDGPHYLRYNSG
jgi:hypothetical protein